MKLIFRLFNNEFLTKYLAKLLEQEKVIYQIFFQIYKSDENDTQQIRGINWTG